MNKIAFFTTVYPININYLSDMLSSLVDQSFMKFDVIVVNDGLKNFSALIDSYSKSLNFVLLQAGSNPISNRQIGINYCISAGYEYLVFGDSDDTFSKNRIELSVQLLQNYDIVVNDLTLFDKDLVLEKNYLSNRLENNQVISFEYIRNKNIFGFTNTAISLCGMTEFELSSELIAVDWYLFSFLLQSNRIAVFTNETTSNYRQYAGNLIGLNHLDEKSFLRGLEVKKQHYKALRLITDTVEQEWQSYYHKEIAFEKNTDIIYPLWWELM